MSAAAPTLPDRLSHTPYITLGGTEIPLPPNARKDLAFVYTYYFPQATGSLFFDVFVPSTYYEIPLYCNVFYSPDSAAGSRSVYFQATDEHGYIVSVFPAPGTLAPNNSANFSFILGAGQGNTGTDGNFQAQLPAVVGHGKWQWIVGAENGDSLDHWDVGILAVIRIPTGGAGGPVSPSFIATPLLT